MDDQPLVPKRLNFIYRWILKGRMDYYANLLEPQEKSFLIRFFFRRFKLGKISEQTKKKISELQSKGKVVFALKDRSRLDFVFIHYLFSENGLPAPTISGDLPIWPFFKVQKLWRGVFAWIVAKLNFWGEFRAHFWKEVRRRMDAGDGMLTYLINPPMLAKRYLQPEEDSFCNLLKWQAEGDEDYYIVPLVVVWSRAPEREERGLADIFFGTTNQPGPLRRLYNYLYLILVEEAIVEAADPVNLHQFIDKPEHQALSRPLLAHRLRDHLLGHFEREKRVILGPRLKSRSQLMEEVLQDEHFSAKLEEIATAEKRGLIEVKREAARYLDEMAANYNQRMVAFLDLVLTWVWKTMFSGIEADESGLENLRNIAKRHPVIYVPSHKSHVDYLALSYVLYHHNFFNPHIVAGINLSVFPLGPVFRGSGAFFMRRSFKGNRVYALVFSNYLKILIKENYPIEFFIEGGRSRTGRLLLPKMGVVKYMVRAYHELGIKDLAFVPVYIGYDQVIDQASYLREMKGEKSDSTLRSSSRMFRQKYGKIYLSFGEAISLKDYLAQNTEKESDDPDAGFENLGNEIVKRINSLTMVTAGSLVASALLASGKPARKEADLKKSWDWFLKYLTQRQVRLAKTFESNRLWFEEALDFYASKKFVSFLPDQESPRQIVAVPQDARLHLEFYKNNILHFFMPAAMTALVKLQKRGPAETARDYARLKQMFRFDFIWPEEEHEGAEFENALAWFEAQASEDEELKNFAGLIANFAESYAIALRALLGLRNSRIPEKEFVTRAHKIGEQSLSLREIERAEAVSNLNFSNALTWMKAEKYAGVENGSLGLDLEAARVIDDQLAWLNSLLELIRQF